MERAIVYDGKSLAVFQLMRNHRRGNAATICAFDLTEIDGQDLRGGPIFFANPDFRCGVSATAATNHKGQNGDQPRRARIFRLSLRRTCRASHPPWPSNLEHRRRLVWTGLFYCRFKFGPAARRPLMPCHMPPLTFPTWKHSRHRLPGAGTLTFAHQRGCRRFLCRPNVLAKPIQI